MIEKNLNLFVVRPKLLPTENNNRRKKGAEDKTH